MFLPRLGIANRLTVIHWGLESEISLQSDSAPLKSFSVHSACRCLNGKADKVPIKAFVDDFLEIETRWTIRPVAALLEDPLRLWQIGVYNTRLPRP